MERILTFTVKNTETISTVGDFLHVRIGLTHKQISRAKFLPAGICKNGTRCRITEKIYPNDIISICLEDNQKDSAHLISPDSSFYLDILYEDSDLLAVNKPSGILTHPSGVHYADSLANHVAAYFRQKGEFVRIRPIGRLDKDTSGIVLFAKNQTAAQRLQYQREQHLFQKEYLALLNGFLPQDDDTVWHQISLPITKKSDHPLKMQTLSKNWPPSETLNALSAITNYRVLYSESNWSAATLRLDTGRTHQIRVHMASLGHPLLGDPLYNSAPKKYSFSRAALHAWKVTFQQPFSEDIISLHAPFPEDFCCFTDFLDAKLY